MQVALLNVCLTVVMDHLRLFAVALFAVPPVGVLSFRSFLTRKAALNKPRVKVLLGYREEDGKPVYFDPKTGFSESPEDEERIRKRANNARVMPIGNLPLRIGMAAAKKK